MDLNCSFLSRFKISLAGMDFFAEQPSKDLTELRTTVQAAMSETPSPELTAVLVYLDMTKPDHKGAYTLDAQSEELLSELCRDARIGRESFFSEAAGSYDPFMNRVTPSDLGAVFPDWTMRFVWEEDSSYGHFDFALALVKGAVKLLVRAQETPQFQATEEEEDAGDYAPVKYRRIEALFKAGLWACAGDELFPDDLEHVDERINQALSEALVEPA